MDTVEVASAHRSTPPSGASSSTPMDIGNLGIRRDDGAAARRRKRFNLTDEEMARRRENNECFSCGKVGCRPRKCGQRRAAITHTEATPPHVSASDTTDTDSEK